MGKTVSWKDGQNMWVHHISEVRRENGVNCRVTMKTKANHYIQVLDNWGPNDNFNVFIKWYNHRNQTYSDWEEILPEADEEARNGRGRVLVSLRRETLEVKDGARVINY